MFANLLGKTMEAYIDDMLVKLVDATNHVKHMEECFKMIKNA